MDKKKVKGQKLCGKTFLCEMCHPVFKSETKLIVLHLEVKVEIIYDPPSHLPLYILFIIIINVFVSPSYFIH